MLSSMLKHHQEQMKGRNETQEKLKKETQAAANELTNELVSKNIFWDLSDVVNLENKIKVRP